MNLVRPLGLAGIQCAVVARPGSPTRFSRFTSAVLEWVDVAEHPEAMAEALLRFGAAQPEPPVLFYDADSHVLFVSRYREQLRQAFRFVVADPTLVESLVDKNRFASLAARLGLPVPATCHLHLTDGSTPETLPLEYPIVVKPRQRQKAWPAVAGSAKALEVKSPAALRELWPRFSAAGLDLIAQELIPGPETCIESYHVYVDERGEVAGEFTGRKIRTYPVTCGDSTALMITQTPDVAELGRELTRRLDLRGVAKFDFKRGPEGKLYLLEINPRFNLWHHPGALAGVNLPALVYADLVGLPRPAASRARPGIRWCSIEHDARAARAWNVPLTQWLPWMMTCEAKSVVCWDDPMPGLRGVLVPRITKLLGNKRTRDAAERPLGEAVSRSG